MDKNLRSVVEVKITKVPGSLNESKFLPLKVVGHDPFKDGENDVVTIPQIKYRIIKNPVN